MEYIFDFHPKRYEGFNTDCEFFKQHYTFNKGDGIFEKVTFGHCGLNDSYTCKDCEYCKYKENYSDEELCASQHLLLMNLKKNMEWTEKIIKDFLNVKQKEAIEDSVQQNVQEMDDNAIKVKKVKPPEIYFD